MGMAQSTSWDMHPGTVGTLNFRHSSKVWYTHTFIHIYGERHFQLYKMNFPIYSSSFSGGLEDNGEEFVHKLIGSKVSLLPDTSSSSSDNRIFL